MPEIRVYAEDYEEMRMPLKAPRARGEWGDGSPPPLRTTEPTRTLFKDIQKSIPVPLLVPHSSFPSCVPSLGCHWDLLRFRLELRYLHPFLPSARVAAYTDTPQSSRNHSLAVV